MDKTVNTRDAFIKHSVTALRLIELSQKIQAKTCKVQIELCQLIKTSLESPTFKGDREDAEMTEPPF